MLRQANTCSFSDRQYTGCINVENVNLHLSDHQNGEKVQICLLPVQVLGTRPMTSFDA